MTTDLRTGTGATPSWLLEGEVGLCPCGCIGKRRKVSYVEKTLRGTTALLRQVMFSEETAGRRGLLQRVDPRAKIVGLLALLVVTALLHNIPTILVMYALALGLAAVSSVPLGFFVKRVWLFIPIFTGIIVAPATLSVVTGGDIVWTLWHWNGHPEGFTAQGLTSAGLIITRVATSVSLVVLLTLTTRWVRLLAALRALAVPRMFVLIIGMAYRYVFVLLATITEMFEARKARSLGAQRHDRAARGFLGASVGFCFGKAAYLSEEVHQAMVARGYRGEVPTLETFRFRTSDAAFLLGVLAVAVSIYGGDRLLGQ